MKRTLSSYMFYLFTLIIILLIVGFILSKQYQFIYNSVFAYLAYLTIPFYEKRNVIKISQMVKCLLLFLIVLHIAFGQYFGFYVSNSYFDKGLHLFGTFAISLFAYQALTSFLHITIKSKLFIFTLICSLGISLGVFLELFEFVLDILFKSNNQKGLNDTNLDMIFNVIGAIIAGLSVKVKGQYL